MSKAAIGTTIFALALAFPGVASAQPAANCPPGSWFCAETNQQPAAPPGQPVQPLAPLPPQGAPPGLVYQGGPPPPVVIYQPPPPVVVYQGPRALPPPPPVYYYHPRTVWPRRNEWGINLHIEGAMIGGGVGGNAGMGGAGFGLRYKPIPAFGIESNVDFLGGTDYNGLHRNENALTFNALVFLNPRSRAQVYLLAGFGFASAHAHDDFQGVSYDYSYFGGQVGAGLELRLSRHFALNADIRGFIRGRTDDQAAAHPEFVDPTTGQTTNTSAGALLTAGATFYF
jgi:opacity protein-like surface antigen